MTQVVRELVQDDERKSAPAKDEEYPAFFIRGIVSMPVVAALAELAPEIVPKRALATTDALAAPPLTLPNSPKAKSIKNGAEIRIVLVTNGNMHHNEDIRYTEFKKATGIMGVSESNLVFMGLQDGKLRESDG
jgi:hypothetical protein